MSVEPMPSCRIDGCGQDARYRGLGLCMKHYLRQWRNNGSYDLLPTATLAEKLNAGIGSRDGCWLWEGAISTTGYGRLGDSYAHRVSYELHIGPIPNGLQVDHLCGVQRCVNPDHLEAVTQQENLRRAAYANRQECKRGHSFDDAVIVRRASGRVSRQCRTCYLARQEKRKQVTA